MAEIWVDIIKSKWFKGIRHAIATPHRMNTVKLFVQIPL